VFVFVPKGKDKVKGAQEELEDTEAENACLKEENVCICLRYAPICALSAG
jgi:hypothetical protein